jgi:hypothetical protein
MNGVASTHLRPRSSGTSMRHMIETGLSRVGRGLLFVLMLCDPRPGAAKDLSVLIRITYEAFLVQQGSAACNSPRLPLAVDDRTIFINAQNYGNRIKQQVSSGLSEEEVQYVLRSAADRAHKEMRQVIDAIKSNPPERQPSELLKWCKETMRRLAEQVVATYVRNPEVTDRLIQKAKAD